MLIVACSFGKDSTALALGLKDRGVEFKLLFTPTGNELPELKPHMERLIQLTGAEVIYPTNKSLFDWIEAFNMLPSQLSRWCTRVLKIEPCIAWFKKNPGHQLAVGLRADEAARKGLYSSYVDTVFPMQDWGWGLAEVNAYLQQKGIVIPERTDCALCPYQRQAQWYRLWKNYPEEYQKGVELEEKTGHTFHSPTQCKPRKDGSLKWMVKLIDLAKQFEAGQIPIERKSASVCRVCSL